MGLGDDYECTTAHHTSRPLTVGQCFFFMAILPRWYGRGKLCVNCSFFVFLIPPARSVQRGKQHSKQLWFATVFRSSTIIRQVVRRHNDQDRRRLFRGWSRLCLHAASVNVAKAASASATATARAARAESMEKEIVAIASHSKASIDETNRDERTGRTRLLVRTLFTLAFTRRS